MPEPRLPPHVETSLTERLLRIWREDRVPLLVVVGVAALLKALYLIDFFLHHPLATTLISDARLYHEWAAGIVAGRAPEAEPFHHPPLYPYVLSAVYLVAGLTPAAMIVLQALLGLVTLAMTFALARLHAHRAAATIVTLLVALYLPTVFFESRLLPTSLTTLVAAAALLALGTPTPARLALGGLLLGVAAAFRPNQLLAIALVAVGLLGRVATGTWRTRLRRAAILLLAAATPILPFFLVNVVRSGEPVLLCDTSGVNLYFANNPAAGVSFRTADPRFGDVATQSAVARAIAEGRERRALSHREVSNHFRDRAIDYALEHPADEARLLARRALAFWSNFEYGIIYTPAAERDVVRSSWLFCVPVSLLLGLAAFGTLRRREPDAPSRAPLVLFIIAQWLTVILFFQYSRFRLVAIPAAAALGAIGIHGLLGARERRLTARDGLAAAVGLVVVALGFLPPPDEAREQEANGRVTLAQGLLASGAFDDADRELEHALQLAPKLSRAHLARADLLRARGEPSRAQDVLEAALAQNPSDPIFLVGLARLLIDVAEIRDVARAREAARAAVEHGAGLAIVHETVGLAELFANDDAAAVAALETAVRLPDATARTFGLLGEAYRRTGRTQEAEASLRRAIELDPEDPRPRKALDALRRSP